MFSQSISTLTKDHKQIVSDLVKYSENGEREKKHNTITFSIPYEQLCLVEDIVNKSKKFKSKSEFYRKALKYLTKKIKEYKIKGKLFPSRSSAIRVSIMVFILKQKEKERMSLMGKTIQKYLKG